MPFICFASTSLTGATELKPERLAKLVQRGRATHSTALLVWYHGKLVADATFGGKPHPGPMMSMTKSIVALAVARLVDEGKLRFDQPVADFYPEWKQGQKQKVTIRHILTHTSGMQDLVTTTEEVYPAPDAIKLALAAELTDPPGTRFWYSNKAANLIGGIVEIAGGMPLDRYVQTKVLQPMGITDARWMEHDKVGHAYVFAGLSLRPADLVRVGRLIAGRGSIDGKRLLSERVVGELLAAGLDPTCGLFWWRIPRSRITVVDDGAIAGMRKRGVDEAIVGRLATLKDQPLHSAIEYEAAMKSALGDDWHARVVEIRGKGAMEASRIYSPEVAAYSAKGYLGQFLVVDPENDLVAVRMVDPSPTYDPGTDGFADFPEAVRDLLE